MAGVAAGPGVLVAKPEPLGPLLEGELVVTPGMLMAPRVDGVDVVWAVKRLARGWVEWRGGDGSVGRADADAFGFVPQGDAVIRVRVAGLRAGVAYELRAVAEAGAGEAARWEGPWQKFRTLDPAAGVTRFAVWNDTHQWLDTVRKLHEVTPAVDFLVWNGDTCNDWHEEEWLVPTLLHPGGVAVTDGRPLVMVWGNHDVRGKWAFRMQDLMATPDGRPYQAFRSGPVACICLHTGEDKPDAHPSFGGRVNFDVLRAEQAAWLERVIVRPEIRDAPYRVVICHLPLRWTEEVVPDFAKGGFDHFSHRSREAWHGALVRWGAQVVVSGHTHQHAFLAATPEFPYAQLVGGGPQLERATLILGEADADGLRLVTRDMAGTVLREVRFPPRG